MSNLTLEAVVPVMGMSNYTRGLLTCIDSNTVKPRRIMIVDNGSQDDTEQAVKSFPGLPIEYIKLEKNIGVNMAWNYLFAETDADIVSVLNNDLILNRRFFEKVLSAFENKDCWVVTPATVNYLHEMDPKNPPNENRVIPTQVTDGWAFSIRTELVDKMGLLPEDLRIYFGDNIIYEFARLVNKETVMMLDNPVYHYGYQTTTPNNTMQFFHDEFAFFLSYLKELERRVSNGRRK